MHPEGMPVNKRRPKWHLLPNLFRDKFSYFKIFLFIILESVRIKLELLTTSHVKTVMNKYILSLLITCSMYGSSAEDKSNIDIATDQIWSLHKRSSKMSPANSEVLYFMPSDAISTLRARKFNDWDEFSTTDSRNLVRLNKGDRVKIIEPKYNKQIYKVILLDGFEKNRDLYIITIDLKKNFKLTDNQ
jgi:hypothetical protein|tara:strand:- start:993 stop:1556 length:564 start_codon:yes stop_codon:yes gene_type:complete